MRGVLVPVAGIAVGLAIVFAVFGTGIFDGIGVDTEAVEQEVVEDINHERQEIGVGELRESTQFQRIAREHSVTQNEEDFIGHEGAQNRRARAQALGYDRFAEVISVVDPGPGKSETAVAADVIEQFEGSDEHIELLLDPSMRVVGVGVDQGHNSKADGRVVVVTVTLCS